MNLDQTYREYESLLHSLARSFHRRHGGDQDELDSRTHLAFLRALATWQEGQGPLEGWLRRHVWCALRNELKRRETPLERLPQDIPVEAPERALEGLSSDGRDVVRLALEKVAGERLGPPRAKGIRACLVRTLKEAGWTAARVAEAFREVGEALSS